MRKTITTLLLIPTLLLTGCSTLPNMPETNTVEQQETNQEQKDLIIKGITATTPGIKTIQIEYRTNGLGLAAQIRLTLETPDTATPQLITNIVETIDSANIERLNAIRIIAENTDLTKATEQTNYKWSKFGKQGVSITP